MEIKIQKRFLVFPVRSLAEERELQFSENGETVYRLKMKPDTKNPDFYAYIDVERFRGKTLELTCTPKTPLSFTEKDTMEIPDLYREPMRPQVHFTPKNGWLNDPNGLIYENGIYHLFYQYNPADVRWGNMHWGHAESCDLIRWKEKDTALFPDGRGMMYSGCAVSDEKNLLGKNKENMPATVLFYTTTQPFVQNISYSDDGFKTIRHFAGNPVLPPIDEKSRDPKVIFCEDLGVYIMALYIADDLFYLFTSDDFVHWEKLQEIRLSGDGECPDIFPLTDSEGNRKWIFMGAKDTYLVGNFDAGVFTAEQPAAPLHYGTSAYAGQTFSGMPDGRTVRMVWNRWALPADSFCGQMGIPMELSLSRHGGRFFLAANPVRELEALYKSTVSFEGITVDADCFFSTPLEDAPYVVRLRGAYGEGTVVLSVFGREIRLDFEKNELTFGDCTAPISVAKTGLDFTAVIDRCSMELFLDGGKAYLSCVKEYAVPDRNLCTFSLRSDQRNRFDMLSLHALSSIWEGQTDKK